ncbi:MAG: hypothetical protein ACO26U_05130 [Burkholderiaceae bacterium]
MIITGLVTGLTAMTLVQTKQWATGDCTLDNGEKFYYAIHKSKGFVSFDDGKHREAFSTRVQENGKDFGVIRHIGAEANVTLVVDLDTGRGYMVVRNDNGKEVKGNAYCVMKAVNR